MAGAAKAACQPGVNINTVMNMVNMSLHDTVNIPTLILIETNNDGRGESVARVVV